MSFIAESKCSTFFSTSTTSVHYFWATFLRYVSLSSRDVKQPHLNDFNTTTVVVTDCTPSIQMHQSKRSQHKVFPVMTTTATVNDAGFRGDPSLSFDKVSRLIHWLRWILVMRIRYGSTIRPSALSLGGVGSQRVGIRHGTHMGLSLLFWT